MFITEIFMILVGAIENIINEIDEIVRYAQSSENKIKYIIVSLGAKGCCRCFPGGQLSCHALK
jgi:fructose-1-phosphate kinase PfkB-like protein